MDPKKTLSGLTKALFITTIFVTFITVPYFSTPSLADDKQEAVHLVEKTQIMLESFMTDNKLEAYRDLIKNSKAVFLIPQLLKGAFMVGASGGNGLLLVRDEKTGNWHGPAFYTVGGASFGLQFGGEASEVANLILTQRGITSFLSHSLKLGADVGVAVGPIGVGASAATANLSADLISFSRSKGLYGGISLDGAVVAVRDSLNEAYYGKKVNPTDILIKREVKNPQAKGLIETVTKAAKK